MVFSASIDKVQRSQPVDKFMAVKTAPLNKNFSSNVYVGAQNVTNL